MKWRVNRVVLFYGLLAWLTGAGCRRDMFNQPKSNPLRASDFFQDGAASRPIPPHTVSRDEIENESFYSGRNGTNYVITYPFPITRAVLKRGQARFDIYCAPCHGRAGDGDGVVVRRGLSAPPPLNLDRLRAAPAGHFVEVIARGYGVMFPQASQVAPEDRWAITAYIRALQLSEHASLAEVPRDEAAKLKSLP